MAPCRVEERGFRGWQAAYLINDLIKLVAVPDIGGRIMAYDLGPYPYLYVDRQYAGQLFTAEDLTQETLIRVYKNLDRIDPDGNFRAWIYRIATNTVFDWLRKKGKTKEVPLFIDGTNAERSSDVLLNQFPSYTMADIENKSDVTKALEKINPPYQLVLILFYYHGFSCQEIANILRIPTGTVKTRLYKARQTLKKALFEQGFESPKGAGRAKEEYGLSFSKN